MPVTPPQDDPSFFGELRDSRQLSLDAGVLTGTVKFRVPALGLAAASFPGLPVIGSDFPDSTPGTIRLDRLDVGERLGLSAQAVVGHYSSDGRFKRQPTKPPADMTRGYLSIQQERADLTIPFFVATRRTIPKYTNNPTTGARVLSGVGSTWEWLPQHIKTKIQRFKLSRQITLDVFGLAEISAINFQLGNIHQFPDGSLWMFNVPTINQISPNKWTVYYEWESEWPVPVPGKPAGPGDPGIPVPTDMPSIVVSNYYVTATEVKPPFYAYQVIPNAREYGVPDGSGTGLGTDITIPVVRIMDKFPDMRSNPTGWTSLPGNPLAEYV